MHAGRRGRKTVSDRKGEEKRKRSGRVVAVGFSKRKERDTKKPGERDTKKTRGEGDKKRVTKRRRKKGITERGNRSK
jgi:hypothetical protein